MCSLLPMSTGLGSCDPSWHRVTFLPPSSVPVIQPALPAARLLAQLKGWEVNFPHQAVQSTQAMQFSASAGRQLCSWTPPYPCSCTASPLVQALLCSLLETGCSFRPCLHVFAQAFPPTPVYFICQPKSHASRVCLLLESFLNGPDYLWTPENLLGNAGNLCVQSTAQ